MNKKTILLIAMILVSIIFISGCATQSTIKSEEEVGNVVTDVGTNIEDIGSKLQDIDKTLGGT